MPELLVRDIAASRQFYCDILGFAVRFERPEEGFLYLEMGRAQLMLEALPDDPSDAWVAGDLAAPFGRGINLQIEVSDVRSLSQRVTDAGIQPFSALETNWYRENMHENGQDEFLVQDPDGYLLRFIEHVGQRAL